MGKSWNKGACAEVHGCLMTLLHRDYSKIRVMCSAQINAVFPHRCPWTGLCLHTYTYQILGRRESGIKRPTHVYILEVYVYMDAQRRKSEYACIHAKRLGLCTHVCTHVIESVKLTAFCMPASTDLISLHTYPIRVHDAFSFYHDFPSASQVDVLVLTPDVLRTFLCAARVWST